jgi:hypothetical protein
MTSLHKLFPLGALPCNFHLHFSSKIPLASTASKLISYLVYFTSLVINTIYNFLKEGQKSIISHQTKLLH